MDNRDAKAREFEISRYNKIASRQKSLEYRSFLLFLPRFIADPYLFYIDAIIDLALPDSACLELAAGEGFLTDYYHNKFKSLLAIDLSSDSLSNLLQRHRADTNVRTMVADMTEFSIENSLFDLICMAGSFSYSHHDGILESVFRNLKKGGAFVAIDTLNSNPLLKVYRYLSVLNGKRSFTTATRIPSYSLLRMLYSCSDDVTITFFGFIFSRITIASPSPKKSLWSRLWFLASSSLAPLVSYKFVVIVKS